MGKFSMYCKFGPKAQIGDVSYREVSPAMSYAEMKEELDGKVAVFNEVGAKVSRINMDIAPPDAPLGDVRPSSSGPVSFGIRVEFANGFIGYFMAEPAV